MNQGCQTFTKQKKWGQNSLRKAIVPNWHLMKHANAVNYQKLSSTQINFGGRKWKKAMLKAFLVTPRLHQKTQLRKEKTVMLQIPGHPKTVIQVSNLQPFNWSCCHKANSSHIALFLLCRIRPQNSTKISQPANSKNLKNKSLQSSALNIHRNSPTHEKNHETESQSTTCLIRWNIWKRWLLLATGAACTWEKVQYNGKASAFSSIKR